MGTLFKHRCWRPIPASATIETVDGQRFAVWKHGLTGKDCRRPIVQRGEQELIRYEHPTWSINYVDGAGKRQKENTGQSSRPAAEKILQQRESKAAAARGARGEFSKDTELPAVFSAYRVHRRIADNSAFLFSRSFDLFSEFLDRPTAVEDLTDETVSAWLAWLEDRQAESTVASHRTRILCLWRFAAKKLNIPRPDDVRRCPPPDPMPEAWTLSEIEKLLTAADEMTGVVLGVPLKDFFRANILAAYDTGLRRGDLWKLKRSQFRADGTITLRQHKTGRKHNPRMRPETVAAVFALPGDCPLAWPGASGLTSGNFYRAWSKLRERAGIQGGGALHKIRRTGATYIARDYGMDAARRFLGHRSPEMVSHYVDESIAVQEIPLPPPIPTAEKTT